VSLPEELISAILLFIMASIAFINVFKYFFITDRCKFFDSKIHLEDYQRFPTFSPLQMNKGAPLPYTSVDSLIYSEKQEGEK